MTVISDTCADISGHGDTGAIYVWAPVIRDGDDRIITPQYVALTIEPDGSFVSPDLEPGPARVRLDGRAYDIVIPDWPEPVRLGPLLAVALPVPPAEEASAVRNLGGVAGARRMTLAAYNALESIDPDTFYIILEE